SDVCLGVSVGHSCHGSTLSFCFVTGESVVGAYGTIEVDAASLHAALPISSAINALHDGVSDSDVFTVKVTDADGASTTATVTIDETETKDTTTRPAVTRSDPADTAANDTFADLTGTLAGSDRDSGQTATLS